MLLYFKNVEDLSYTYINIVGDVLLSAAYVAYLGPFILDYRRVRISITTFVLLECYSSICNNLLLLIMCYLV